MKPLQYFSPAYLEHCRQAQSDDILAFLEDFRALHLSLRHSFPALQAPPYLPSSVSPCRLESLRARPHAQASETPHKALHLVP